MTRTFYQATDDPLYTELSNQYVTPNDFNAKYTQTYDLTVLHLNIHSLNSKLVEFSNFIQSFNILFDIIAVSEVWSNNIEFYHSILPGYSLIYDLPENTNVGGFAFL